MLIKGIVDEDFVNYKRPSMFINFPNCSFKCDKEAGCAVCQNSALAQESNIEIDIEELIERYIDNLITSAIVCGGLEPFDSWKDLLSLISKLREKTNNEIIIYTGYNKEEIEEKINILKNFPNIIIKFGRFIPNQESIYDELLGVKLASNNQYAIRLGEI